MFPLLQSTAGQKIPVILKDAAGAVVTGVTTPTLTRSKAGGSLGALHDGTWAELGFGLYTIQLDDTDTDTVGAFVVRVAKTGCVDSFVCCSVRATTEAAVKLSVGTGTGQLNVSGGKAPATVAAGDAVGLPSVAAGAKGGLPILDASTGLIVTGYGPAAATILLPSSEHANVVTDVGTALNTALPGSPTAASAASRLKALVDAAAGGTGGVSLVGSKMDMVDVPNVKALLRFWAGAAKVTISGDAKTITFLTAADATLGTLTTADGSTWTLTVS